MKTASQDVNLDADGKRAVECGPLVVAQHMHRIDYNGLRTFFVSSTSMHSAGGCLGGSITSVVWQLVICPDGVLTDQRLPQTQLVVST